MVGKRTVKTVELRREVLHRAAKKKKTVGENKREKRDTAKKKKPTCNVKHVKAVKKEPLQPMSKKK